MHGRGSVPAEKQEDAAKDSASGKDSGKDVGKDSKEKKDVKEKDKEAKEARLITIPDKPKDGKDGKDEGNGCVAPPLACIATNSLHTVWLLSPAGHVYLRKNTSKVCYTCPPTHPPTQPCR